MIDWDNIDIDLRQYRKDTELDGLLELTNDDIFRWLHYHAGKQTHHSSDIDLACVDVEPQPHVAAFIEFKNESENPSFPQAVLFEALSDTAPVYIVRGHQDLLTTPPADQTFSIEQVTGMDRSGDGGWIETDVVATELQWGGHVSGAGDLDPAFESGVIGWESDKRAAAQRYGGRPLVALDPGDVRRWANGDD